MPEPADYEKIPEAVPPYPLPEFNYEDLEKGERIGTGGDADVYRATVDHQGYSYTVAVKEPRFDGTIQKRVVEKFQTEAETWYGLNSHENIVSVYAWGAEPLPWLGLEFMDSGTLENRIDNLDIEEALWLAGRIAEGIRYGHRHGVAHLDIKPTNVLLRDTGEGTWNYPKVSDWGLAKMLLEHSNSVEGISPTYAAPEQFDSEEFGRVDDITDIYQLGAVVYALLAGEPPFTGSSTAVMRGVLDDDPEPPSAVNPNLPAAVDDVVLKALAKQKDDRYEGVLTFRQELDRLFEEFVDGDGTTIADETGRTERTATTGAGTSGTLGETDETETASTSTQNTQSTPSRSSSGGTNEQSSTRDTSGDDSSSLVTRRRTLGALGVGAVGVGGGWMTAQLGEDNDSAATGTVPTDTPTPTDAYTATETSAEVPTATDTATETSTEAPTATDTTSSTITNEETIFSEGFENGGVSDWDTSGDSVISLERTTNRSYSGDYSLHINRSSSWGQAWVTREINSISQAASTVKFAWFGIEPDENQGLKEKFSIGDQNDNVIVSGKFCTEQPPCSSGLNINGKNYAIDTHARWILIELRNIDYQNNNFDLYIDQTNWDTDVSFQDTALSKIDYFSFNSNQSDMDIYIDGIKLIS